MTWKKIVGWTLGIGLAIQLVPYGHDHTNPPVVAEPSWDSPWTRETFMRACGDCHSHETKWPWYSHIAPVSWLIVHDVEEGREHFNVSMWGMQRKNKGDEAAEEVEEGEMPPAIYLLMHPEARLDEARKRRFVEGLKRTFGEEGDED